MKDHEKKWGLQNLKYWAVNNLYGWAMLQMLLVNDFNWFKETSKFHESYKKKVDIEYVENLHNLYNDLASSTWMCEKIVANLHQKTEYVVHIRNLKQASKHGLVLKKVT